MNLVDRLFDDVRLHGCRDGRRQFAIDPEDLLTPRDRAGLHRRRPARIQDPLPPIPEEARDSLSLRIFTHHAYAPGVCPQSPEICQDVPRPAETFLVPSLVEDRHGRLRGDARHLPEKVSIEDQISYHEDSRRLPFEEDGGEPPVRRVAVCAHVDSNSFKRARRSRGSRISWCPVREIPLLAGRDITLTSGR